MRKIHWKWREKNTFFTDFFFCFWIDPKPDDAKSTRTNWNEKKKKQTIQFDWFIINFRLLSTFHRSMPIADKWWIFNHFYLFFRVFFAQQKTIFKNNRTNCASRSYHFAFIKSTDFSFQNLFKYFTSHGNTRIPSNYANKER